MKSKYLRVWLHIGITVRLRHDYKDFYLFQIMLKLADDAPNRPTMKTFIGMMESLDFIINR